MKQLSQLGCCWLLLTASAPEPRLPYDLGAIWGDGAAGASAAPSPPGRPLDVEVNGLLDDGAATVLAGTPPPAPAAARARFPRVVTAATVDLGVVADSNINNATDLPFVVLATEDGSVPVPLPAESRRRSGVGLSASSSASLDLRVSDDLVLAGDAEAFLVDQEGGANDDASVLAAIGPEMSWGGSALGSLQLLVFQRWYGGVSLSAGAGLRGNVQIAAGEGSIVRLLVDARWFGSDYGPDLEGRTGSLSLSLEGLLDPATSGSATAYVRRQSLGSAAFSSTEVGLHAGASRYVGPLVGSLSIGVSRSYFDAPQLWLSPDPRRDWRLHGAISARTRQPLLWNLYPNFSYTFGRTASSEPFYDADRHALRLGIDASF